jgi:hypothetical protein
VRRPPWSLSFECFWVVISDGRTVAETVVAVGVSVHAGFPWFHDSGELKPGLTEPMTSGPRPRLTLRDRFQVDLGVKANESLNSIGGRLKPPTFRLSLFLHRDARRRQTTGAHRGRSVDRQRLAHHAASVHRCRPRARHLPRISGPKQLIRRAEESKAPLGSLPKLPKRAKDRNRLLPQPQGQQVSSSLCL